MQQEIIALILRNALQIIGGALITKGIMDQGTWEAIAGGTVAVATVVWSYLNKKKLVAAAAQ